jgi:hypothetical protein
MLALALVGCQAAPTEIPVETPAPGETPAEQATGAADAFVSPLAFDSPLPTPTAPGPTPTAPAPAPGKGVVRGGFFSTTTAMAIADTSVYLIRGVGPERDEMPPVWPGPVEGDVKGRTDAQGWFVITDVPPGVYYVAIWAPLDYVILDEYKESVRQPTALNVQADQVLDLGYLVISWP